MHLDVRLLPNDGRETDLSDTVCIVMDVFRATTSIITAIGNGCAMLIPVASVDEAYRAAGQIEGPLFAGERQSIKIDGFNFGNSPFEFAAEQVQGKTIIMTTTNGTIAIKSTENAYLTLLGSFINASAVCRAAQEQNKSILLVCAGTDGLFSLEDAFCAGLLVKLLTKDKQYELTDAARGVQTMYHGAQEAVLPILSESRNGKRLYSLGLEKDVEYCLCKDSSSTVPCYRVGKITSLHP
ncbi:2-phosphosulfolactate phosphatase [Anaerospora sp.]|uniref:2-phosphosulfolactate phosphatase n=1 Tax=Anaerospora sp. TaxID=1960278 RepID=UPI00289D793A|nr:2-phosphosulfolactate phosphatase [Anaerospora sp.]